VQHGSPIVLIVDDDEDSVAMYAIGLLAMGFQPIAAGTAEDGFVRACENRPDVVVADVMLRGSSGLDLARRLRQDARTRHARIIVLTGQDGDDMEEQAFEAGCDRFVVKPCAPDQLAVEILGALDAGHQTH
jgi:DNA-binding response OmpR family regulator